MERKTSDKEEKRKIEILKKMCNYKSDKYAQEKVRTRTKIGQLARTGTVYLRIGADRKKGTKERCMKGTTTTNEKLHHQSERNKYYKMIDMETGKTERIHAKQRVEIITEKEYNEWRKAEEKKRKKK